MRFATALSALAVPALLCCGPAKGSHDDEGDSPASTEPPITMEASTTLRASNAIKTVWVVVMENHDWDDIVGNPSAPYINGTLLPLGAHAEAYTSPGDTHPSEPNYIWMEAGDDLNIADDDDPSENYRTTKNHLTNQLEAVGVSWKAFQEGIGGESCPLTTNGLYAAKHNPFVFFDDVTDGRQRGSKRCIDHVRPYAELESGVARYNFITPDLCNDMHNDSGCASSDTVKNGDTWLSHEVPKILGSQAYKDGGALFITWDENEGGPGHTIGMIALSPYAKPGYASHVPYNHSSLLRSVQDIFGVRPYIRDAANVRSFDDLFTKFP